MELTRISTPKLQTAIAKASAKIDEAEAILQPYLVALTEDDRATMLRTRPGFPAAVLALARSLERHPDIAEVAGFESDAVTEDVDNVTALAPLAERLTRLSQHVADSKLAWLAEALQPALAAYGIAKVRARQDGTLRSALEPLAAIFASRRTRSATPASPK